MRYHDTISNLPPWHIAGELEESEAERAIDAIAATATKQVIDLPMIGGDYYNGSGHLEASSRRAEVLRSLDRE